MLTAHKNFQNNLKSARELGALYTYLQSSLKIPMDTDDLLRFQLVHSLSAFDKLIHDLVRIGMMQTFTGVRLATGKFNNESISMGAYALLSTATVPPKEHFYELEVVKKLKTLSFQDPDKVSDGLSYIWAEKNKWYQISLVMKDAEENVRTQLRLIVDRRNQIVHEADVDIVSGTKRKISLQDSDDCIQFIEKCGDAIVSLVA